MSTTLPATGPNSEQIQHWNQQAGPKWVALHQLIDLQIRPLGEHAMNAARIDAGDRILDVGCGCGDTTRELARRVGADGHVTGIDISTVMLERARQVTQEAGLPHVRFENADAQTHRFAADSFDVIFSRFGVMFFASPVEAFRNLRTALRPGGRVAFVCWQGIQDNPWMMVPMMAALQHIPPPPMPGPDAPGPFAFANADKVRDLLTAAGLSDVDLQPVTETLIIGGGRSVPEVAEFMLQMGPTAATMRDADANTRAVVSTAIVQALQPYATPQGVRMGSASWVVTARRA